jgi:uncharacterized protein (DUF2147 family)
MKYVLPLLLISLLAQAQNPFVGKWKSIDDETGKDRSIIEIYEQGDRLFGKVIKTFPFPEEDPDPICNKCSPSDPRHNKKIIGMDILQNMKKSGNSYTEGNILDPKNGKIYTCKIWLEGTNLMVRGYWGPFYRTQIWVKVH